MFISLKKKGYIYALRMCEICHVENVIGKRPYEELVENRLVPRKISVHNTITTNPSPFLSLMSGMKASIKSKDQQKIVDLRKDNTLFAKLHIASLTTRMNVKEFLAHESMKTLNQIRYSLSQSKMGFLRPLQISWTQVHEPNVFSLIIDGSALAHMLILQSIRTSQQNCDQIVKP